MFSILRICILIFFLGSCVNGWAQKPDSTAYGMDYKGKRWSISFFAGISPLGPRQHIEDQMDLSGFMYRQSNGILPGFSNSPNRIVGWTWSFLSRFNLANRSGIEISMGNLQKSVINAYDDSRYYNDLRITSRLWNISLNYVLRTGKGNDGFVIGPTVARLTIDAESHRAELLGASTIAQWKPGFNVGYSYSVIQKKSWFLSLRANYTWLPDAVIGPYTVQNDIGIIYPAPVVFTSTFNSASINLQTLQVGVTTGWRF